MFDPVSFAVLGGAAVCSALLGAVAGSGGAAILLPVTVMYFGVHEAIPMLTIATLSGNLSRVWFHRRELDPRVAGWFILGSVPLAVVGAWVFTVTAPEFLIRFLGGLLIALVAWRRLRPTPPVLRKAVVFLPLGVAWGFLAGFSAGVGPLMAPFYLAYGLFKGAYIGTDALGTIFMQLSKLAVFGGRDFLHAGVLISGVGMVPFMVLGTWLGTLLLARVPERAFAVLVEITMLAAGLNFLIRG